jgi:glutathione synthase/RimK-type ligase-like ATP-grasp enzyme
MKTNLIHIGSTETIDLTVGKGYIGVPAKVDTGADYSSIWVSDTHEHNGKLSFSLFGPGAKHYTGETITTEDYGVTVVKNSFGHSEQRYKVRLPVVIGNRRIKVEFRLAERSRNRYPILIGKRTLLKKFVVDVSVKRAQVRKVLVLNSMPSKTNATLFDTINAKRADVHCDFRTYDDFALVMSEDGLEIIDLIEGIQLKEYELFYFKTYIKKAELAASFAEYAQANAIPFIDAEVATYHSATKVSQYAKLSRAGIAIPKSIVVSHTVLRDQFEWLESELSLPFILKDGAADRGVNNFLIKSQKEFLKVAKQARTQHVYYVAQEFIENDGDSRFLVFGSNVEMIIERRAKSKKTHLNNTSTGASATLKTPKEVPSNLKTLAVKSAIALNRQIAGVDLIKDKKTGKWYVLEVNNSPQLAFGTFLDEKLNILGKFLKNYARK